MISTVDRTDLKKKNAEGDFQLGTKPRTTTRDSVKRLKTSNDYSPMSIDVQDESAEEFFFRSHPFSDVVLLIDDKELFVDKSVLSAASKVFQNYFKDENIDTIELLDVSSEEMIELLRFLYPQFQCIITKNNVTTLLILANRFEFQFIISACRTFIDLYLSKIRFLPNDLIEQDDGTRVLASSMIDLFCIWFREFANAQDEIACQSILKIIGQCRMEMLLRSNALESFDSKLQCQIFRSRAKHLEKSL